MRLIDVNALDKFLDAAEKEATKNRKYVFASAINTIRGNIRNFPSAQPNEQIKWERDTAIRQLADLGYGLGEKPRRDDCISRQAAIDEIVTWTVEDRPDVEMPTDLIDRLRRLPSAEPERKRGKWIIKDNPGTGWYRVTCSECGEDVTSVIPMIGFFPNAKAIWDFCPNCGADMRGGEDETD